MESSLGVLKTCERNDKKVIPGGLYGIGETVAEKMQ